MRCHIVVGLVLLLGLCEVSSAEEETKKQQLLIRRWHSTSCFNQDFIDFYINEGEIDAQEARAQFKGDLDSRELHQFFIDIDKDNSRTVTLPE